MDFSHEFLMFQHGNHSTNEKLEYYQNFIITLLVELKALREAICTSCQQKCASSKATRSENQSLAAPNDLMRPLIRCPVEDDSPTLLRMPEKDVFWRTPASGSISLPINETIASDSNSPSTERRKESDSRRFYAERDVLADSTIDVTFVHSYCHENSVRCVGFSHDGRYLAVGTGHDDKNGSIFIYGVESQKKYCELREYASQYGSYTRHLPWNLNFSSDGRYLAVVNGAARIIIWDVPKKRIRCIFHGSYRIYDVRFSPDGRLVAFWTHGGVVVLNMRDNSRRMASEGGCFDFNPGGRLIATGYHNSLMILDLRTGKDVKRWNRHGKYLACVKFTLDGRGLLCVYDEMIEQWDVSDGEPVLIWKLDAQNDFYRTSISPDLRLLAYLDVLLDVNSGKPQYTFKGHIIGDFHSVDFSAAGTYIAIGSHDRFVSLWRYTWT